MKDGDNEFKLQEQFGKLLEPDAFLIFQAQVMNPESVVSFYLLFALIIVVIILTDPFVVRRS